MLRNIRNIRNWLSMSDLLLGQPPRQILGSQMGVALKHLHVLVAGDRRQRHDFAGSTSSR